jgi:DNA-binding CsgD family transcriptional regulator
VSISALSDFAVTRGELDIFLAYAEHGRSALTARALSLSESHVKNMVSSVIKKTGSVSSIQAYYRLLGGMRFTSTHTVTITAFSTEEL